MDRVGNWQQLGSPGGEDMKSIRDLAFPWALLVSFLFHFFGVYGACLPLILVTLGLWEPLKKAWLSAARPAFRLMGSGKGRSI